MLCFMAEVICGSKGFEGSAVGIEDLKSRFGQKLSVDSWKLITCNRVC
jgi:hypothetical protein